MPGKTARKSQKIWMRVLTKADSLRLAELMVARQPRCTEWQFKYRAGNVIIYVPIIPYNPATGRPDPAMRYMAKLLRVVPEPGGPFRLEYMRHTGQWAPVWDAEGELEQLADFIEREAGNMS